MESNSSSAVKSWENLKLDDCHNAKTHDTPRRTCTRDVVAQQRLAPARRLPRPERHAAADAGAAAVGAAAPWAAPKWVWAFCWRAHARLLRAHARDGLTNTCVNLQVLWLALAGDDAAYAPGRAGRGRPCAAAAAVLPRLTTRT